MEEKNFGFSTASTCAIHIYYQSNHNVGSEAKFLVPDWRI